ncbi:sigma-70 family RNA polymerase sigma factor [Kitasatospora acidiphila]|uniref:Sigma-70 family RNA polymerase sigma factor n=1 Tax=Kitasatospora acidiphila TaxID=2567942 RepID=A0A540W1Y4_9ACTN|nr:sigma-70 family RNA polymerase sigma factor [Kitasatospora acidiphila]TQF03002.1 sigma-70 family RNA polymerase sigma factor [Kitasatospora acidiphila]
MDERDWLAAQFEEHRPRLRAIAYRILGSLSEADDAVQDTWLRLNRTDAQTVENLGGWLTTVVSRVCLNALRSREHRREDPLDAVVERDGLDDRRERGIDPEEEALLADSVGLALLVVLDTLSPAERVAFVLHDMFAVPFEEIGPLIDRTPATTRQLASRARRRVKGNPPPESDLVRQRKVVSAYLAATRAGDFDALLALLDPQVVLRADTAVGPSPTPILLRGAQTVAKAALASTGRALTTQLALLDGSVGLVMAPHGRLALVLAFTMADGKITEIDVIAEPERLPEVELAVLED